MAMATELSDLYQVIDQLPENLIPKLTRFVRALLAEARQKQINTAEVTENSLLSDMYYAEFAEREELRGWLKLSESSYSFWDNERDAAYDTL